MKINAKTINLTRWWDLPAALLFLATMLTAAARLSATRWTDHLGLVSTVAFLGVIAGLALGQSRFSPGVGRFFGLAYGLFFVPWQLGLTLGQGVEWRERMLSLGNRMWITIEQLANQEPVTDNLFFLTLMAVLFWSLSLYGGYSLTRHAHPWRSVLPVGLAMVIIHAYDPIIAVRGWYLAAYFFFGLLLVARTHFLVQQHRWKQNRAYLPPYLGLDFVRIALIVAGVLVLLAWTAPALASALPPAAEAWKEVSRPWNRLRDRMSNAFSALQASVGIVNDFYGDSLALGRGNPLSDAVVLTVEAPARAAVGVRYYWRARVYDRYEGEWTSTSPNSQPFNPKNFKLNVPDYEGRAKAGFTIKTFFPIQNLYAPAQPLWISRPVQAHFSLNPDTTVDYIHMQASPYLQAGEVYQVEASLSSATIKQLREAGEEYPSWVSDRYLQLPDTITARTSALAKEITAGLETPYDKAQAITNYLRENLEYSEVIPLPPAGKEPLDWVLFDHKQAFCNYYASSEVILLRLLGVPARLAVGYASGERQPIEVPGLSPTLGPGSQNIPLEVSALGDRYTVRHKDAHAWPEVFFPGLGWVEFEPTVSETTILRSEGLPLDANSADLGFPGGGDPLPNFDDLRPDDNSQTGGPDENGPGFELRLTALQWTLLSGVGLAGLLEWIRRVRQKRGSPPLPVQIESGLRRIGLPSPDFLQRWVRYATLSPLVKAYLEINRALARLGKPASPPETPAERGRSLGLLLPVAGPPIHKLVSEYQDVTYGRAQGDIAGAQQAGLEIRKQSFLAWLQRLFARFQEPKPDRRQGQPQ